jgi:hypothetical protein
MPVYFIWSVGWLQAQFSVVLTRASQSSGLMTDKVFSIINLQPTMSCRISFFLFKFDQLRSRSVQSFLKNG